MSKDKGQKRARDEREWRSAVDREHLDALWGAYYEDARRLADIFGFPAERAHRESAAFANKLLAAPYEVANARAKALLDELYAERLNKTPKVQPVNKPAEPRSTGLGRAARRFLAFCETLGRTTKEIFH